MPRLVLTAVVTLTLLAAGGPALAFQCPRLVKQIHDATATRFDAAAAEARTKAAQATALHEAGKHAEAENVAKEALRAIGVPES